MSCRAAGHVELCRKEDSSVVVLGGLLLSCWRGSGDTRLGEGDMPLLLPLPGLTLEVTSPMALEDFICDGVSKRRLDAFDLPPITWGWDFMGCRVEHPGMVCDLQDVSEWGRNPEWERGGIKTFWEEQAWKP